MTAMQLTMAVYNCLEEMRIVTNTDWPEECSQSALGSPSTIEFVAGSEH